MSDDAIPTLDQQVTAVELAYLNRKGSVEALRALVQRGKRSAEELKIAEVNLPPLRQAWLTMKFIRANAEKIKAATAKPNPGASGDAY